MAQIAFVDVDKVYGDGTKAVSALNLEITDGEFMVLVGPSGCGKTTALRMVAGLEEISAGEVRIGERVVNHVPAKDRDLAMVFQSYALYPHMTVADNMAFGLQLRKVPKDEIRRRVEHAADILGIHEYLERKPRALSGGQRQRVAMGRAIVREPQAFLMDEPLSNLDAKLRVQMRAEISGLQRELGVTTLYVTHDQTEAMTMGHRVAVLRKGELQQVDEPQTLYDHPVNLFVAGFIGSPAMNMVRGTVEREGAGAGQGDVVVRLSGTAAVTIPAETLAARPALEAYVGREVILGIRPEDLEDAALARDTGARLTGQVRLTEALGSELVTHVEVAARPALTEETREVAADVDQVAVQRLESESAVLVGRFAARSDVKPGQAVEMAVETRALHFFDPETALAIYEGDQA